MGTTDRGHTCEVWIYDKALIPPPFPPPVLPAPIVHMKADGAGGFVCCICGRAVQGEPDGSGGERTVTCEHREEGY